MHDDQRRRVRGYSLVELMAAIAITLFIMAGVYGLMLQNQHIYETQTRMADSQQSARVALDLISREVRMAGSDPSGRAFNPDTACITGEYKPPATPAAPHPDSLAALTVAEKFKIRIKMDRPDPARSVPLTDPPPLPPTYKLNDDKNADGDYLEDDEAGLGDGFIDDDAEDITFEWNPGTKLLTRTEIKNIPAVACRPGTPSPAVTPPGASTTIAEHIKKFEFKYYSTILPPSVDPALACPAPGKYASADDYETARETCDPSLPFPIADLSLVRRIRVRITAESDRPDPYKDRYGPKAGHSWVTLVSEIKLRNR